jgi:hypothetical protein
LNLYLWNKESQQIGVGSLLSLENEQLESLKSDVTAQASEVQHPE